MGVVQGAVTHAVHRLRPVSAAEHHRRVADHGQYADRSHMLRHVRRSRHDAHPVVRHFEKTLPREGFSTETGVGTGSDF